MSAPPSCCIALQFHHSPNCLTVADDLIDLIGFSNISLGIIGLIDCIIGRNGLIDLVGCTNRNGVIGIVGHWIIGFVDSMILPWPNSLAGLLTLADCWIVGSLGDLGLISALWVFRLVVNISLIEPFVNRWSQWPRWVHQTRPCQLLWYQPHRARRAHWPRRPQWHHQPNRSQWPCRLHWPRPCRLHRPRHRQPRRAYRPHQPRRPHNSLLIGLIGLIGLISLGNLSITSLVCSSASSARQFIGLIGFLITAKTISRRLKQAAALRVATLQSSATKIVDVAFYYFASSSLHVYSLVREMMLGWLAFAKKHMWWWIASIGESYHGDVLQFAKLLFSVRLLLLTKFFVMRECDNILSGYLCAVTTVFSLQDGICGFKFPKRIL